MTSAEFPEALSKAVSAGTLDPKSMYVENIRHALDLTTDETRKLCQEAECQGTLAKTLQYLCANDSCRRAIESSPTPLPADQELTCEACECMELPFTFQAGKLSVMPFYSVVEQVAK